jgi:hypothetical protein
VTTATTASYNPKTGTAFSTARFCGANAHIKWNFDAFSLTSVSDYLRTRKRYCEDTSRSPVSTLRYNTLQHYCQISQELWLNGPLNVSLHFNASSMSPVRLSGLSVGANRLTGTPSLPMRNFVKFHLIASSPRIPGSDFFKYS